MSAPANRQAGTEMAAALQRLADYLEGIDLGEGSFMHVTASKVSRQALAAIARAIPLVQKRYWQDSFWLEAHHGVLRFTARAASREVVCRKIVTGRRHVPKLLIPAHDEEIVEWQCQDPLLAEAEEG